MIENLNLKLEGLEPITRIELFELVNSWGRTDVFYTNDNIFIQQCEPTECYPLENLDISNITDLSEIFRESYYNGNLSKWNLSNCIDMERMFFWSSFNNDSLKDWDVSNIQNMVELFFESCFNGNISNWNVSKVTDMCEMFSYSIFNGDISNWNVSNVLNMKEMFAWSNFDGNISKWQFNENVDCEDILFNNNNFENKYNNGIEIPYDTKDFIEWFEENRINIANANISKEEILEIDDYLDNFNSKGLTNEN